MNTVLRFPCIRLESVRRTQLKALSRSVTLSPVFPSLEVERWVWLTIGYSACVVHRRARLSVLGVTSLERKNKDFGTSYTGFR